MSYLVSSSAVVTIEKNAYTNSAINYYGGLLGPGDSTNIEGNLNVGTPTITSSSTWLTVKGGTADSTQTAIPIYITCTANNNEKTRSSQIKLIYEDKTSTTYITIVQKASDLYYLWLDFPQPNSTTYYATITKGSTAIYTGLLSSASLPGYTPSGYLYLIYTLPVGTTSYSGYIVTVHKLGSSNSVTAGYSTTINTFNFIYKTTSAPS